MRAAAAFAAGIAAEKIYGLDLCLIKSTTSLSAATYPPKLASDLEKVPIIISTSFSNPKCSAVPLPCSPITPKPCASSTMTLEPYCFASLTISGRFAISPLIEKTPSVKMSFPLLGSALANFFSKSSISLWLYLTTSAYDNLVPS